MSDQMLRELRDIDRGVAEVKGQLASLPGLIVSVANLRDEVATITPKIQAGAESDADKERRLRTLEEWKAKIAGQIIILSGLVAAAAAVVTKLVMQ